MNELPAQAAQTLILGPAIALGIIIGIYEILVIHRDVQVKTHRFGHGIHALFLSVLFVLITMNTQYFLQIIPAIAGIPVVGNVHILRVIVGLIAAVKIHGVSRAISGAGGGRGMGETWFHSILIGGLIIAAPYIYPAVQSLIPGWLNW